jgi:thiol-disulfide isomerase/thioredoxin
MKRAFTLIAATIISLNVFSQGIEFQHGSFQEALDMARAQGKHVFMDCYTSWCGPCKRMAATVFVDSAVGEYFNANFINTKFDMEKGEGVTLAAKYGIRAYPTLLWLDADGEVVNKVVGGQDPVSFINSAKKVTDPTPGILSGMKKKYDAGEREIGFLRDYMGTMLSSGVPYEPVFKEFLTKGTAAELAQPENAKAIFNLTNDIKSDGLAFLVKNKKFYTELMGEPSYTAKVNSIAEKAVKEAGKKEDKALFDAAMNLLKTNKAADSQEKTYKLSMDYYSSMNDWDNYDLNASAYIKKYASKDTKVLNEVAWTYYLNVTDKTKLDKAAKWAYSAINIDNKYNYNLTYAYLLYKLDNYKEAEKACDYAVLRANEEKIAPSGATALKTTLQKLQEPAKQ